eukprot:TRINITY_DN31707_c0_g1_i1.p1 TRINITY_DN31707_c0_g1~~TRINITY_DN31707_c0_g1_i1.p1  ORF type:complete len:117 (+),score=29.99 TRINITY_DN31707_c0_g1_i1:3-353(+)
MAQKQAQAIKRFLRTSCDSGVNAVHFRQEGLQALVQMHDTFLDLVLHTAKAIASERHDSTPVVITPLDISQALASLGLDQGPLAQVEVPRPHEHQDTQTDMNEDLIDQDIEDEQEG